MKRFLLVLGCSLSSCVPSTAAPQVPDLSGFAPSIPVPQPSTQASQEPVNASNTRQVKRPVAMLIP